MAYAASALSFMLEHLGKTVVLTGSMIPLCEVFNDARRNLLLSLLIAANVDVPEVCIFFNHSLFRGNRCLKLSSSTFVMLSSKEAHTISFSNRLDAFASPNYPPLATLGVGLNINRTFLSLVGR